MPKLKSDHISPTPEEDAAIADDPDTFEADAQWFREAKPLKEVLPELNEQWYGNTQQSNDLPPTSDNGVVRRPAPTHRVDNQSPGTR